MDVQKCVATIQGKPTGLFRSRVPFQEKIKCIAELAHHKERYWDSLLMSATRDEEPFVQATASAVMISRFNELKEVRNVEERMRQLALQPTDPRFWSATRPWDETVVLVCIASVNHSGHVRQAALAQMTLSPDPHYLPFILKRMGDWVQQVRDQARTTLMAHKAAGFRTGFLAAINEVEALLTVKRVDLRPVYEELMHWLVRDVAPEQLLAEVEGLTDISRFRLIRYLLNDQRSNEGMLRSFIFDRNFLIRKVAVSHLVARNETWSSALLQLSLNDAFPSIRVIAFKELIRRDAASEDMLNIGLTDTSFEVREQAAKQLGLSGTELLLRYSAQLKTDNRIAGSLLGLSDLGDPALADVISSYADHGDQAVRRAVLFALGKISPEAAYDQAMVMIADRNKRVRTKAEGILLERHDQAVVECGRELLRSSNEMHRSTGLSLLNNFGGWQSLAAILGACMDPSSLIADQAWAHLDTWTGYAQNLFTRPTAEEIEMARSALLRVRSELKAPTIQQTRSMHAVDGFLD
jgi:HEAT repeat protein